MKAKKIEMEFVFILVEPAVPENIGAAARAMKTMGHRELRLINTTLQTNEKALWLAHGSKEILENSKNYPCLRDAITDLDFVMGTTAKYRSVKWDYYTPEDALILIHKKEESLSKIGIVFGREESGLMNKELQLCDIAIHIPIKKKYPSINLAQAVMLLSYVFSSVKTIRNTSENKELSYSLIKKRVSDLLNRMEIPSKTNLYGRIMERLAITSDDDLRLILSILNKAETQR